MNICIIGTATKIKEIINKNVIARSEATRQSQPTSKPLDFDIVSNPEFLREGSAVYDFTHPDKIVIGTESDRALKIMQEIYRPLYLIDTPFVITNPETAELIKYACNAFLATKITFINEIANLCDKVGGRGRCAPDSQSYGLRWPYQSQISPSRSRLWRRLLFPQRY